MKFNPRPYQLDMIRQVLSCPRTAIWAGMGMGKTASVLTALDALRLTVDGPALVLAPLRVARSTWPDEVWKWSHLDWTLIEPVVGNPHERAAALRRKAHIYTMNYDNLPWLVERCGDDWPFPIVVADESTRLKSFRLRQGGKRAAALAKVAHKCERFIELTGTPSPNGLADLWGQMWFLDKGERLGRTYSAFLERWFRAIPTAADYVQYEPLPHARAEIEARLSDICFSLRAEDYFDLDEPIVNEVEVDLPPAARKAYKEMERHLFAEIAGHGIEAANAAAKTVKCLQLANGAAYTDEDGSWTEVHRAKIDALDSVIEEAAGASVLVAYHFKSDLARLQKAFPFGKHLDKSPQTIRDWNDGKIRLLFAHPASAGHGLNLQDGGNILAFFGHWWDLEQHQQIIERLGPTRQKQAGHNRPVYIHHILARDTVDELVLARIRSKRSVQDLLLEAMRRKEAA